ncbi:MAG: cadherin-like beta sandwich domain-containing protein, partial [Caldilineaceae bacterium]|nr:cadherin-like beta sandwich domain-containing protein [Caldilineaceae bacterium]
LYGKTAVSIIAGNTFSLALCSDGTLTAWGGNSYGQLGNSSTIDSWVPVLVDMTSGASALNGKTIASLSAGGGCVMALCTDGFLAAWGNNTKGQLGINSLTSLSVPVAVSVDHGVSALSDKTVFAIASGSLHNLAFCSDGSLASWGDNTYGQLGINNTTASKVPVLVDTSALAAGEFLAKGAVGTTCNYSAVLVAEPAQPTTTTREADTITATGATLNGIQVAAGYNTALSFDYGTTAAYGINIAGTPATSSGGTAIETRAILTGLTPGTTYHYRLKSVSGAGTLYGDDRSFTTPNNDASLAGLVMSSASINPGFSSEVTSYTAVVPGSTTSVKLTPTLANNTATVKVNGVGVASGSASQSINLSLGENVINTVITAEDGTTTQTYTVVVTRSTPNPLPANYTSGSVIPLTVQGFTATGSTVNFSLSYAPAVGSSLTVVKNAGVGFIHGTFDNLAQGQLVIMNFNG